MYHKLIFPHSGFLQFTLKEEQLGGILSHIYTISIEGLVLNTLAVLRYRKQTLMQIKLSW